MNHLSKPSNSKEWMRPTDAYGSGWSTGRSYHDLCFNSFGTNGNLKWYFCHFMLAEFQTHCLASKPSLLGPPEQKLRGTARTGHSCIPVSEGDRVPTGPPERPLLLCVWETNPEILCWIESNYRSQKSLFIPVNNKYEAVVSHFIEISSNNSL